MAIELTHQPKKDEAWAEWKIRNDDGCSFFYMSPAEVKKSHDWWDKHCHEKHPGLYKKAPDGTEYLYTGAIGGGLTYSFSSTSLGTIIKCKCFCDEEFDLTDYDSW